jgi:TATA-binding protein-associated factor Taf7
MGKGAGSWRMARPCPSQYSTTCLLNAVADRTARAVALMRLIAWWHTQEGPMSTPANPGVARCSESGSEDESDEESEDSEDDLSEAVPSSEEDSDGEEEEDDEDDEDDELDDDDDDSDDDDDDEDDGDDIGGRGRRNLARARELLQAAQQRLDSVDRTRHGLV